MKQDYRRRPAYGVFITAIDRSFSDGLTKALREHGVDDERTLKRSTSSVAIARRTGALPPIDLLNEMEFGFTKDEFKTIINEKKWQLDTVGVAPKEKNKKKEINKIAQKVKKGDFLTTASGEVVEVIHGSDEYKHSAIVSLNGELRVIGLHDMEIAITFIDSKNNYERTSF